MPDTSLADLVARSAERRRTMVDCQIRTFDVTDQDLLARMLDVPRELFLPPDLAPLAYSDLSLDIRLGDRAEAPRSLLAPLILARLLQGARVSPTDKILDVASAGGYTAALLAGLAGKVVALESERPLYDFTRANLDAFGLANVETVCRPLDKGVPGEAPFDVIVVNGAVETRLEPLVDQLKDGGRLVAILHLPDDPTGRASKAVLYERIAGTASFRILFDATAPVLDGFHRTEQFTFA